MHSTPSTNFLGVPALFGAQNLNLGLFYPRFGSNFGEIRSRTIEIDWNGLGPLWTHIGPALGPSRSPGAAQGHVGPQTLKVPRLGSNFGEIRPRTVEIDENGLGALGTHPGPPMGSSRSCGAAQGHVGAQKSKVARLSSNFEEIRPRTVEMDGNGLGALRTHPGPPVGSSRSCGASQGHVARWSKFAPEVEITSKMWKSAKNWKSWKISLY